MHCSGDFLSGFMFKCWGVNLCITCTTGLFLRYFLHKYKIIFDACPVRLFDGLTGLMQMLIFFLLGLLSFPSRIPHVIVPALLIAVWLTFIARPVAVSTVLTPFKSKLSQQLLVSWSGLRGAASIVFAIMATMAVKTENDIFHIVFMIVLFGFVGTKYNLACQIWKIPVPNRLYSGTEILNLQPYAFTIYIQFTFILLPFLFSLTQNSDYLRYDHSRHRSDCILSWIDPWEMSACNKRFRCLIQPA